VYIQPSIVFVKQSHISGELMITFVVMQAEITVIRSLLWTRKERLKPHSGLGCCVER
jgi:hypothetical protein